MTIQPSALVERAKLIGMRLRDARQASGQSLEECAAAVGIDAEQYEAYELGEAMISLPELELAAFSLDLPLDAFWEDEVPAGAERLRRFSDQARLIGLRNRMIGALLRQARLEASLDLEELAQAAEIDPERLQAYELGQVAAPLPELETLCAVLKRSPREFLDQHGPVGDWNARRRAVQAFMELPLELQVFISRPVNRPYLDLAVRLSDLNVERLRLLAEGLLEITY